MVTLQKSLVFVFIDFFLLSFVAAHKTYQPTWSDLDSRPLPTWYDDVKFGIFIHWGLFSVPSYGSEWFWMAWKAKKYNYVEFMKKNYPPNFSYQDFARDFTAEFFNATEWAEIFRDSGAKYVVLTSKHHEGYTMWPSKQSFSWNARDTGPHKDLLGELAKAVRKEKLTFGVYYSLYEWFNPMYLSDRASGFNKSTYSSNKMMPELYELVNKYRPEIIWADGDWEATDSYFKSKEFLAWLYNESPVKDTVVANDRWGRNIPCHHGDFYTCTDHFNPGVLQPHKWENCMTIDKRSWGFRRNAKLSDYLSVKDLIKELVMTVSCGGNLLMNVGPTKDGIISPIFQERLRGMGEWLRYNGRSIYNTHPWTYQNDTYTPDVWYTQRNNQRQIYVTFFNWPKNHVLQLRNIMIFKTNQVVLLGKTKNIPINTTYDANAKLTTFRLPPEAHQGLPAWVLEVSSNDKF